MGRQIYFDLETTSQWANTAEILEFSYIIVDTDKGLAPVDMGQMYFMPQGDIPASATAVHGLNRNKLAVLSHGKEFYEKADSIQELFLTSIQQMRGYNSKAYDLPILQRHLAQSGVPAIPENLEHVDMCRKMKGLKLSTRDNKLGTLYDWALKELKVTQEEMKELFISWAEEFGIEHISTCAHSALFDSFMTLILYSVLESYGYIS